MATNLQSLAAIPAFPGGLIPREPLLEFDMTENRFRNHMLIESPVSWGRSYDTGHGRRPRSPKPVPMG
ncbi:MAG: hypothetical protein OXI81_05065 [Paracoccaceae bacterium]|nr:hypothetical protein [Paracoccaceae bacterium]